MYRAAMTMPMKKEEHCGVYKKQINESRLRLLRSKEKRLQPVACLCRCFPFCMCGVEEGSGEGYRGYEGAITHKATSVGSPQHPALHPFGHI